MLVPVFELLIVSCYFSLRFVNLYQQKTCSCGRVPSQLTVNLRKVQTWAIKRIDFPFSVAKRCIVAVMLNRMVRLDVDEKILARSFHGLCTVF